MSMSRRGWAGGGRLEDQDEGCRVQSAECRERVQSAEDRVQSAGSTRPKASGMEVGRVMSYVYADDPCSRNDRGGENPA